MADAVALRLHFGEDAPQLFAVQEQVVGPFDPRRHPGHPGTAPTTATAVVRVIWGSSLGGSIGRSTGRRRARPRGGIPLPAQPAPAPVWVSATTTVPSGAPSGRQFLGQIIGGVQGLEVVHRPRKERGLESLQHFFRQEFVGNRQEAIPPPG